MSKKIYLFIATVCLSIVFVSAAYAHKVQMFAYAEGDQVFVEGYFADGKKAMGCKVTVFDSSGTELLNGITNDSGQFNFKAPKKSDLRIVLDAGMGHKTEYTLPAGEIHVSDGNEGAKAVATPSASKDKRSNIANEGARAVATPSAPKGKRSDIVTEDKISVKQVSTIDDAQLQANIEKAVQKSVGEAIKPLVRSFTELQQKNSFDTIVGGIGYILGLMGVVLYFKSRRSS
ncbi:MAG: hypothetical protein IT393_12215 [Nitrospirae bacterium]|nr:hypothetical protein [Nitrospirota bacterium]